MKILINLISEQQIPNILFIKENPNVDKYIFITTEKMQSEKQVAKITNTLNIPEQKIEEIKVNQEDYFDIIEKLKSIKYDGTDEILVNITGGNKIMALAVYDFFTRITPKTSIYYLPFEKNEFLKIHPDKEKKEIKTKLTLKEYLFSYTYKEKGNEPYIFNNKSLYGFETSKKMLEKYMNYQFDREITEKLRQKRRNGIDIDDEIRSFLDKLDFEPKDEMRLNKYEVRYLTGGWLEELLYYQIKEILKIDDKYISLSVNSRNTEEQSPNDFDVMCCYNNKLYIFECKTSLNEGDKKLGLFNDTIYKIAALIKDKGLSAEPFLVTTDRNLIDENGKIKEDYGKRAKFHHVKIICFVDIKQLKTDLEKGLLKDSIK
jgi:hypothetical protein